MDKLQKALESLREKVKKGISKSLTEKYNKVHQSGNTIKKQFSN